MSIKEQCEFITHEVTEKIVVDRTMYCDVCGKEIVKNASYWEVIMGCFDTIYDYHDYDDEPLDVCSDMCLMTKFFEFSDKSSKSDWDADYFEVERKINRG